MRRVIGAVDRALFEEWRVSAHGLAAFRIFFGLSALLFLMPNFSWVTTLPGALFRPPLGPMRLVRSLPPDVLIHGTRIALVLCLTALVVGYRTRVVSYLVSALWLFGAGLAFSFGKTDHVVLPAILPALFAHSGWGNEWSIDGSRKRVSVVRTWPFTLFAICVGVSMAYAAFRKLEAGWLRTDSHATLGHLIRNVMVHQREDYLATRAMRIDNRLLWEASDWATVAFEASLLFAWLRRSTTRAWACTAAFFHLFVTLTLNIPFVGNVFAYAAWLPWTSIASRIQVWIPRIRSLRIPAVIGVLALTVSAARSRVSVGFRWLDAIPGVDQLDAATFPIVVAVIIAGATIVHWIWRMLLKAQRSQRSASAG